MIVQLRGTSGSGKTYSMREGVNQLRGWTPVFHQEAKRKRPIGYQYGKAFLMGSYENTCGGCDGIGSARQVFEAIDEVVERYSPRLILAEGLLLSEDAKWALGKLGELEAIFLVTEIEDCIRQIKNRRAEAGNEKPLNESNTRNRTATIERARLKLSAAGVPCPRLSSSQAVKRIQYHVKLWS